MMNNGDPLITINFPDIGATAYVYMNPETSVLDIDIDDYVPDDLAKIMAEKSYQAIMELCREEMDQLQLPLNYVIELDEQIPINERVTLKHE